MFENIMNFFKKFIKKQELSSNSKDTAKERLHLVLMQDRANVSADFLDLMKQEIIEVIKKYIEVDESAIDVRLTNKENEDGTNGAPALYANIPIVNIKEEAKKEIKEIKKETEQKSKEEVKSETDNSKEEETEKEKVETSEVKEEPKTENKEEENKQEKTEQKEENNTEQKETKAENK